RKRPIDLEERVAAEIEADEIAKLSILSHHHGLERIDVWPADFVALLDLHRIPYIHEFHSGVSRERAAGIAPTGKMRPSMPMSPTCALFGIPPRATTAQFSNPNGGYLRSSSSVFGKSRTTIRDRLPKAFRLP